MNGNKKDSRTDWAKADSHMITKEEYEEIPELEEDFFTQAKWENGGSPVSADKARTEIRKALGRPIKENPKQSTTIRFDADILEAFKAGGKGWQTRINDALRDWLSHNKVA